MSGQEHDVRPFPNVVFILRTHPLAGTPRECGRFCANEFKLSGGHVKCIPRRTPTIIANLLMKIFIAHCGEKIYGAAYFGNRSTLRRFMKYTWMGLLCLVSIGAFASERGAEKYGTPEAIALQLID